MIDRTSHYIDGRWRPSTGTGTIDVIDATTEEAIGRVAAGTAEDANAAVAAARAAFDGWSRTPLEERIGFLTRAAQALQARQTEIATLVSQEVGMPFAYSNVVQAGLPVQSLVSIAEVASTYAFEETVYNSLVVREPIGVVVAITPWNYPLHQVVAKVAPALAAGCTVVLKPSEVAPLTAFVLAEVFDQLGLPPGVFNVVTGTGQSVGEALVGHDEVDMVSLTGSTVAGRRIGAVAAQTIKKVALELGGKSPLVVLDDADLVEAVSAGLNGCFLNSGQTCIALTRMLVPRAAMAQVEAIAAAGVEQIRVGGPFEPDTVVGPLVSAQQRDRVVGYIEKGIADGARLVAGGPTPPDGLERGYFVRPTVFTDVSEDMAIVREEIFGPVLVIQAYDDEEQAIRLANDTPYGLNAAVFSADRDRAVAVGRRIRAGQVQINDGAFNIHAPFGGYKQSGNGREFGAWGLDDYLETKSMQLP
ncbi:aldehyde dehydrogenase [Tsukamurella pulmonis]|uniref:aldehyde dehydrogenase (NAD(+)) n=1 Tax=Tsukamurella pulmonis TaxID=47312 RepID=A0A1H1BWA7_9ACTN|nr:aldehyde dehydrogenase family protein [Tsukamurella pulmonis]KXO90173.1 aldehyde dehydrogenase [Tsukamurella pulmonis]SDQ56189.1 aldehyde dehydrogenase (NAD+) [Tsukamurella pulmonis]SUP24572.1 Putative aldehyde dehydrogenase SA1924 [Tsukamurella pulmonis]